MNGIDAVYKMTDGMMMCQAISAVLVTWKEVSLHKLMLALL